MLVAAASRQLIGVEEEGVAVVVVGLIGVKTHAVDTVLVLLLLLLLLLLMLLLLLVLVLLSELVLVVELTMLLLLVVVVLVLLCLAICSLSELSRMVRLRSGKLRLHALLLRR